MKIFPFFLVHAGCPHRCSYCNQRTSEFVQPPLPTEVAAWLEKNLPVSGQGEVAFYGGTFTLLDLALQQSYCAAVQPFIRAGRVRGIRVSTRPDALSDKIVRYLSVAGVTTVELGCQSFDQAVLLRCGRDYSGATIRGAVDRLRTVGMAVGIQLMPALPGGDRAEALDSLLQALQLKPDFLRIYPTLVLAGTRLAEEYFRGKYQPWTLDQTVDVCAELFRRCQDARVPVIRMGIQATAELDSGAFLIAGPYHPAFGQLVRSRLWRQALACLLEAGERQIVIHGADLADALGQRRENFHALIGQYGGFKLSTDPTVMRDHLVCADSVYPLLSLTA